MNIHKKKSTNPKYLFKSIFKNISLIKKMTWREIIGRYKGSILGIAWSFFNPILMLLVYTFIFNIVFKARWDMSNDESKYQFAITLFVGMIIHGLFAEVLNRSPTLITYNTNYVKKIVFPLEILSIINLGTALFHTLISIIVLLTSFLLFNGFIHWTVIFLPLILLPLIILILGISWFLSSLGVYLRDINQIIGTITTIMMFFSPVFYPVSALPESIQKFILINPLTFIIEQARNIIIWGILPDALGLAIYMLIAITIAWFSYIWFQKTRQGFADVL